MSDQVSHLQAKREEKKEKIDAFVADYLKSLQSDFHSREASGAQQLFQAISYSLKQGGKRFRPVLCLLLADAFAVHPKRVLPWATAIEMIHTYSLIHDDLPCMDNDDFRRGEPTNHKVFGESTALLAGDALLTEAFKVISTAYKAEPHIGLHLVQVLSEAAGFVGMVGGQAIDLDAKKSKFTADQLMKMQELKTGALIRASAEGTAIACGLPEEKVCLFRKFGELLGFAFQLKDDLHDSQDGKMEKGSFPDLLGLEKTKDILDQVSNQALEILKELQIQSAELHELVQYNRERSH